MSEIRAILRCIYTSSWFEKSKFTKYLAAGQLQTLLSYGRRSTAGSYRKQTRNTDPCGTQS